MGYTAPSKKAIKDAIKARKDTDLIVPPILDFYRNVQETSFFGTEAKVPGENTVVGPDAYTNRKWFATLTVNEHGMVTAIR
jgi:hypothetical protein